MAAVATSQRPSRVERVYVPSGVLGSFKEMGCDRHDSERVHSESSGRLKTWRRERCPLFALLPCHRKPTLPDAGLIFTDVGTETLSLAVGFLLCGTGIW